MVSLTVGTLIEACKVFTQDRHLLFPTTNGFFPSEHVQKAHPSPSSGWLSRHHYSDYRHPNLIPVAVWTVMVQLCQIQPPGKLQSTLCSPKMHSIHHLDMDVTDQLQLGGTFSTTPAGPTPGALVAQVPAGFLNPAPVIPGAGFSDLFILDLLPWLMIQITTERK